jgi:hypothetical protein
VKLAAGNTLHHPTAKRAALRDITNTANEEEENDPSDGRIESCPKSLQFAKFEQVFDGSGSRTILGVLGPERFLFVMFFNMFFYSKFLKGLLFY